MGTFADTENVDFRFFLPTKENKLPFSVYIYIVTDVNISIYIYLYIKSYIYVLPFQTENGSRGDFPLLRLPFAHHANGSLSFVRLLTKKQTELFRLQTD